MKRIFTLLILAFVVQTGLQAQCNLFYDGFESGSHTPTWTNGTGTFTRTVTTTSPAVGTYCMQMNGGTSGHYQGIYRDFPVSTPSYVSWYAKSGNTGTADTYFVIGDANVASNNGILFVYFHSTGRIRFIGNSSPEIPYVQNQWYFIEMRNINYTTKTFDLYLDNVLVQASLGFRSSSSTNISRVHLYNYHAGGIGFWDDITIGQPSPIASPSIQHVACNGDANATVSLNVSNGTPGYSYQWSTGDTIDSLAGLSAGAYLFTVTDVNGCASSDTIVITEPDSLTISGTVMDETCFGSTDGMVMTNIAGGTPGYTYTWSNGDSTQSLMNAGAGTYSLQVTDTNGCITSSAYTIGSPAQVLPNITVGSISCNGENDGFAMSSPSGGVSGYSYMWSTGDSTMMIDSLASGVYSVMVTDSNGCMGMDSVTVSEPAILTLASAGSDVDCNGAASGFINLTVAGGTPSYTYMWSNSMTTQNLSGIPAGSYSVVVTDSNGCTGSDSLTISEPTAIVSSGTTLNENQGLADGEIDLTVTGGTPVYTYLWSNGATTEDLTGLSAGTYTVTITDGNGCMHTDTFMVDLTIGINDPLAGPVIGVYPVPAQDMLFVSLPAEWKKVSLSIWAANGSMVKAFDQDFSGKAELNINDLPAGMYFLQVQTEEGTRMQKWIKE